jgi:isopenicillin-N N-acyltransferase-like protein
MKSIKSALKLARAIGPIALAVLFWTSSIGAPSKQPPSDSSAVKLKVLLLEGSSYNRGLVHGRTLKKEIGEVIKAWKSHLEHDYKMEADKFIGRFVQETNFIPAIKKWTPDLLDEVKGIAEGSGIDFNTILLFQLPDEEWVNAQYIQADHCSAMGVSKRAGSPALIAQNLDLYGFYNGYQTVLHIKHQGSDLESFVFTCAGLIAANGMNNKSVAICCNTLAQLAHCKDGLPVAFVVRGVLAQRSQKDAINFLRGVKHASGQNYVLGGPDKVYDFECSAGKVVQYIPYKGAEVVYHTNHPIVNEDINEEYRRELAKADKNKLRQSNSYVRFDSLETRLKDKPGDSVGLAKTALVSRDSDLHPICRRYTNETGAFTFGSTIMVLSGKPELIIAAGSPDLNQYRTLSFTDEPEAAGRAGR